MNSSPVQVDPPLTYPGADAVDVALRDGSTVHVRPVRAEDRDAIDSFLHRLSPESIGFRFFGQIDLDWVVTWAVEVDYSDRYALVATSGPSQEVCAHAAYIRTAEDRAEVAFTVADDWQGYGIATIMLAHLAAVAERNGVATFTAEVLPANHRMIQVFRDSGFAVTQRSGDGVIEIELPTSRSPETRKSFQERDRTAAIAAVRMFLEPKSVAVIGASPKRGTVGGEIFHNLRSFGYTGSLYPVSRRAGEIDGLVSYRSIGEVAEPVELAVIAVAAEQVCEVARECEQAGAHALLVISAGFAEADEDGAQRQHELLSICRQGGMRLVGPNCLGAINTTPAVRLNSTFAGGSPPQGDIGFLSQSGGLGIAIIEVADRLGLGLSSFISVGNKADVSGNDLLDYWEQDEATNVVLLYLESFGNPRRFARIARRVSATKPIVAVKSGRSPAGARATASHTGALLSASDVTVDALFRQAGVIRTDTMHELFDVGALLSAQPVPAGERVAIVTNAGGPGIMCADACQAAGLDVVSLDGEVRNQLAQFLAAQASFGNPVDMIATASAESYRKAIETLVRSQACDSIVCIFVPPLVTQAADVAREIRAAAAQADGVTVTAVFMNSEGAPAREADEANVPTFEYPEDAAHALAHAAGYGSWRARPQGQPVQLDRLRIDEATAIVAGALADGGGWLDQREVWALLDCYGLPLIETRVVASATAAVAAARELGSAVVLKAIAKGLVHKSDAGAVRVNVHGPTQVRAAAEEIAASLRRAGYELEGLIVQPMAQAGVELLAGVVHDESFGPVLACGAGGTSAEVLGDVAVRITPLTDVDAREMLRGLRMFPLLEGYRGAPACDTAAVEDVLLRLSALVEAHPEVAELDVNPLIAHADGAVVLDARIRLAAAQPPRPMPSL